MLNINFVPDDYIQSSESHRANLMYLALFAVVMVGLGGSFMTIKIRQRALNGKETLVNARIVHTQEAIKQFEELQAKRKMMMKTALMTAGLLEPVPRSVLLASLTNNLPPGTSLLRVNLVQKEPPKKSSRRHTGAAATSKYQAAQTKKAADLSKVSQMGYQAQLSVFGNQERLLETHIDIEGIAPTDLQVAAYIERLASSPLLENVTLVESKEDNSDKSVAAFRQFKLTTMLRKDIHLDKEAINKIRGSSKNEAYRF